MNKNTIKPDMTVEAKAKFNAQYWHQKVLRADYANETRVVGHYGYVVYTDQYLILKPLSSITDEDSIKVAKIAYPSEENWRGKQHTAHKGESLIDETFYSDEDSFSVFGLNDPMGKLINITDFLRSRGYAIPFMGWSVEEMVEAGWIKLKGG